MPVNCPAIGSRNRFSIGSEDGLFEQIAAIVELQPRPPIRSSAVVKVVRETVFVIGDRTFRAETKFAPVIGRQITLLNYFAAFVPG